MYARRFKTLILHASSRARSLSFALDLTLALTLALALFLSFSLSLFLSFSLSLFLSLSLPPPLAPFLYHFFSLELSDTVSHALCDSQSE